MIVTAVSVVSMAVRRVLTALSRFQVELHGKYSLDRIRNLHTHSTRTSWWRILFWCFFTPTPCLVYNTLMDLAPLAKPSAGRDANYVLWIRLVFVVLPLTGGIFEQIRYLTPQLEMTRRDSVVMSVTTTSLCLVYDYILVGYISLPVPFFFLAATPTFLLGASVVFAVLFGKKLMRDAGLRTTFYRAIAVIIAELTLTVIYPIYIYGFKSIPSSYQNLYIALVPLMKIAAKNIMAKFIGCMDDLKPEVLVFNIDTFNSLYVSLAMQNATTVSTSLFVMLIDFAQGCISVSDVYNAYKPIKRLMKKLPKNHPLQVKTFMEVAMVLDQVMAKENSTALSALSLTKAINGRVGQTRAVAMGFGFQQTHQTMHSTIRPNTVSSKSSNKICDISMMKIKAPNLTSSSAILPAALGPSLTHIPESGVSQDLAIPLSKEDCAKYLLATRRLLFTVEFVILTEYSEVIIPVFYSLYTAAEYHLPNRQFYATIANIDEHQLRSMVVSVLGYACLELASVMVLSLVLHRIIGISPMRQVGFVLETQNGMIQSKLLSWVLYAVQNALEHLGADFSFQFKWLKAQPT